MANTRIPGVFNFSANFEALIAGPLDARSTVFTVSELTNSTLPYPYLGMTVAVTSDPILSENGVWILKALPATIKNNWFKLSDSGQDTTVTGYTFNGTVATIELSNGNDFNIDINDVEISGLQYSVGVSNHSYELITTGWTQEIISGDTYNTHDLVFGGIVQAAKQNIVVIDLNTTDDEHHLVYLPTGVTYNDAGVIYKIIAKSSNNTNLDKYLMVYSPHLRIIATNIKTRYNNSYFLPLETMESVEIIWDGYDYLVTNMVKQGYVALNAKNFIEMNTNVNPLFDTCYIQRDINSFL
jgi:hypothetical protein